MNKKGALELSVNAIVILIIALTILGLVLGFAVSKFRGLSSELTLSQDTPEATAQVPIQFPGGTSELTLSKTAKTKMAVSIYNSGTAAIDTSGSVYKLDCAGPTSGVDEAKITFDAVGSVPAGSIGTSSMLVGVDPSVAVGSYSCILQIGDVSRSISLEIQ